MARLLRSLLSESSSRPKCSRSEFVGLKGEFSEACIAQWLILRMDMLLMQAVCRSFVD